MKVTDGEMRRAAELYAGDATYDRIAEEMGCSRSRANSCVRAAVRGGLVSLRRPLPPRPVRSIRLAAVILLTEAGYTSAEIGGLLGLPPVNVRQMRSRAGGADCRQSQ